MFQLDLTWNPFNKIEFGQSYAVFSYGITNKLNYHGYISNHSNDFYTWYSGLFYQFYKSKRFDFATAIGFRKRFDSDLTHFFSPQFLYTIHLSDKLNFGGSIVNVFDYESMENLGQTIDLSVFYKIKYKSKKIENITIGLGGFHPTTWKSDKFFLPTYSIDILFR